MGLLIAILNNLSKFLVKRLSKKIENEIWLKIFLNFDIDFWFDVKYRWSDENEIHYDIITENTLSLEDDLKIIRLTMEVEKKYPAIDIEVMLLTEKDDDEDNEEE
jgi:hypothetical protein